ncbi:MAG TPA: hypothetical protein VIX60_09475 [Candidatus Cybelea sp.]
MVRAAVRDFAVVLLCVALTPATQARAASTGFVDLSRLVATHPLHALLTQYDREIAALRNTQHVSGLQDPGLSAEHAAASLEADAATAGSHAAIGGRGSAADLARERQGIAGLLRSQEMADRKKAASTSRLVTETNANLRAYGGALAERTQRAYTARQQQLREKESSLAYELERRDAGKRLLLRLKLDDLHANAGRRAQLQASLAALQLSEARGIDALRRYDASELAAYRAQLERAASAEAAAMDLQLRTKSQANYAILQRVFNEEAGTVGAFPLASEMAVFSKSYAPSSDARSIAAGMRSASRDVALRFQELSATDTQSKHDLAAQIASLQADRAQLYRSILVEIGSTAKRVARERHLSGIEVVADRASGGGLDLTPLVESRLKQKW